MGSLLKRARLIGFFVAVSRRRMRRHVPTEEIRSVGGAGWCSPGRSLRRRHKNSQAFGMEGSGGERDGGHSRAGRNGIEAKTAGLLPHRAPQPDASEEDAFCRAAAAAPGVDV